MSPDNTDMAVNLTPLLPFMALPPPCLFAGGGPAEPSSPVTGTTCDFGGEGGLNAVANGNSSLHFSSYVISTDSGQFPKLPFFMRSRILTQF